MRQQRSSSRGSPAAGRQAATQLHAAAPRCCEVAAPEGVLRAAHGEGGVVVVAAADRLDARVSHELQRSTASAGCMEPCTTGSAGAGQRREVGCMPMFGSSCQLQLRGAPACSAHLVHPAELVHDTLVHEAHIVEAARTRGWLKRLGRKRQQHRQSESQAGQGRAGGCGGSGTHRRPRQGSTVTWKSQPIHLHSRTGAISQPCICWQGAGQFLQAYQQSSCCCTGRAQISAKGCCTQMGAGCSQAGVPMQLRPTICACTLGRLRQAWLPCAWQGAAQQLPCLSQTAQGAGAYGGPCGVQLSTAALYTT